MFDDMNKLYQAAGKFATDAVDAQIEDARATIARQQRKIRQLNAQKKFFKALISELSKPPKPFKPMKLNREQRKALRKAQKAARDGGYRGIPVGIPVVQ